MGKAKRKFLKTIYEIQKSFGVDFAGVSRTFSFGIKPIAEEKARLEEWFRQIGLAKEELYKEVFEDFKKSPNKYLGKKFDYATFFKGSAAFGRAKKRYPLLTTQPVGEGLRMELSISSFITNHKRHFDEAITDAKNIKKQIEKNTNRLSELEIELDFNSKNLTKELDRFINKNYNEIIKTYEDFKKCEFTILAINELISDYNYELNQIMISQKIRGVEMLEQIGRLDSFPGTKETTIENTQNTLADLEHLAEKEPDVNSVAKYVERTAQKAARRIDNQRLSFERRLAYWLAGKKLDGKVLSKEFLDRIDHKIADLKKHIARKAYDAANRNLYYGLLALRARLANPDKILDINTLKSKLSGSFLRVRGEREIITLPGFSWKDKKPLKNIAFAFKGKQFYICIAASAKAFLVGNKDQIDELRFLKTSGGSKQKAARKPKTVTYVAGDFDLRGEGSPLFLPLHFGKSQARRYVTNKQWGLFSDKPKIFLNNARLKRTKENPGDPWKYFLDVTLSADEKVFGFREFQKNILKNINAVIGIDRGEVNPIAYAVVKKSGDIIETDILGRKEYIEKLKQYDDKKKLQQSRGRVVSKSLRAKISRLQKATLETAVSKIIALAAKYRAAISIEDLGSRFSGKEVSLISKKTYKRIEDLLANALNFAGLLRIGTKGPIKYWGGLLLVAAAGTSSTCIKCGVRWRANAPSEKSKKTAPGRFYATADVIEFSRKHKFSNINIAKEELLYNGEKLSLNPGWKIYSKQKPQGEVKNLADLKNAINKGESEKAEYFLRGAIHHRPIRDVFVCHACGFSGNSDEIAAVNIARRGFERVERILTK